MLLMGFVVGGKPTASKESIDGGNGVSWGDGGGVVNIITLLFQEIH